MEIPSDTESKPNPIQVDRVEACFTPDFIPDLPPDYYRPGQPCDHPGCGSHLSHPCEGCGRYAAGLQNGPDVDHVINCEDCGLQYLEFGIDTTLPNDQWLAIHPEGEEGVLCANCIVKRVSLLPGIIAARMTLEFA